MLAHGLPLEGAVAVDQHLVVFVESNLHEVGLPGSRALDHGRDTPLVHLEPSNTALLEVRNPALDDRLTGDLLQRLKVCLKRRRRFLNALITCRHIFHRHARFPDWSNRWIRLPDRTAAPCQHPLRAEGTSLGLLEFDLLSFPPPIYRNEPERRRITR